MKTAEFSELQFSKFRLRVPEGYWYAGYDTWVRVEGEEGVIGVTDFFQTKIGDIAYVNPAEEASFEQDDVFATLESIKAILDLTIPASGEVIAFNPALQEHPELVSQDPVRRGLDRAPAPDRLGSRPGDAAVGPGLFRADANQGRPGTRGSVGRSGQDGKQLQDLGQADGQAQGTPGVRQWAGDGLWRAP